MKSRPSHIRGAALLLVLACLAACGQTGPLTLPGQDTAGADQTANADDSDSEDER
jgi:predicted small lipoprotein YifL